MAIQDGFAPSYWLNETQEVAAAGTIEVGKVDTSIVGAMKYIISVSNKTEDKYKRFEMVVGRKNSSVVDSVFAKIGDSVDLTVLAKESGGEIFVEIINNETYTLNVDVFYIISIK